MYFYDSKVQNCFTVYYQLVAQCFLFVINYCSDMFRAKFMAIFRELISVLTCTAYVVT